MNDKQRALLLAAMRKLRIVRRRLAAVGRVHDVIQLTKVENELRVLVGWRPRGGHDDTTTPKQRSDDDTIREFLDDEGR